MKAILFAILFFLPLPSFATTWYVRADGGTRYSATNKSGQCTGTTDAPYPGSGKNKPCAVSDPRYLYSDGGNGAYSWAIAGGDTVLLRGGPWRIGQNTAASCGPFSNACAADNAYIPPPPAGSAAQPTTFRGENYASCSTKTQLYGGYTVNGIISLRGTNHVQLQCLEITDRSQCTTMGVLKPVACNSNIIDDYAKSGILTDQNTHDITLQDIDIHGLRDNGIVGAVGGTITATRVRIAFNGQAGWNFDDGLATKSVNGQMNWSYVTIEGNGCVEEYPITHSFPAAYCYDDGNGGYGDGVGTPDTQISFAVDHATIRYNTQDGLDLLHTSGSSITVTDSSFYGNMGQQLKLGPMAGTSVTNSLFLTNCKRMSANISGAPSGWNTGLSDFCRAQAGVVMVPRGNNAGGGTYTWQNNDFVGYAGDAMFEISGCTDTFVSAPTTDCTTPNVIFQNNLMAGYPYVVTTYHYGELPPTGTDGAENVAHFRTINHNIYYNMRTCPTETASVCTDPHLAGEPTFTAGVPIAETLFDTVNFALTSASTNAIGKGISVSGLDTDYNGANRTSPTTIGALIYTGTAVSTAPSTGSGGSSTAAAATAEFAVSPNSTKTGRNVTATINVTGNESNTPTGKVTLYLPNGAVTLALSAGSAVATFTPPGAGTYTLTASYSGDATYPATLSNEASFTVVAGSSASATADAQTSTLASASATAVGAVAKRFASMQTASANLSLTPCSPLRASTRVLLTADDSTAPCAGAVQVSIVPAYRTLYADQPAALQSMVLGGTNQNVEWSLLTQPSGGDGRLLNSNGRDTVFSATIAGRYTLVATSLADPSQTATATLYVTGHKLPYAATALGTEPVDCSVDPALLGATYDVGPSQTYVHLRDLPWSSVRMGTTIRVHNEDTSGTNPTTYHEYLGLSQQATPTQPLRICGVPDNKGQLPILDASNATAAGTTVTPVSVVALQSTSTGSLGGVANIEIEGLEIRDANASTNYVRADGTISAWAADSGCVDISGGQNIVVIGNDLGHCGSGGHSGPNTGRLNTLWEGNHLHDDGVVGSGAGHQLSLEASGEVVQFNRLDSYPAGAQGANIRSRGTSDIIRYNYLGRGPIRQIDLTPTYAMSETFRTDAATLGASAAQANYGAALERATRDHMVYGNYYQGSSCGASPLCKSSDAGVLGTTRSSLNNR